MAPGSEFTTTIEKPVAGGRMLTRHEGQVVLVAGAIPGERVRARVIEVARGVAYAAAVDVIEAHPARRMPLDAETWLDGPCGGNVYHHIDYGHQLSLKKAVVIDAFSRIGRLDPSTVAEPLAMVASPERGYRMRARLHLRRGRIGFFCEGTHRLCDPASTGQLLPVSLEVITRVAVAIGQAEGRDGHQPGGRARSQPLEGEIELTENVEASERVLHFSLDRKLSLAELRAMTRVEGLTGFTTSVAGVHGAGVVIADPHVRDELRVIVGRTIQLRRHVRSFFQGNRFLLNRLVAEVLARVPDGPVIDLYAGVGVFGVALAASGRTPVIAVEVDAFSVQDLKQNAAGVSGFQIVTGTVEDYLQSPPELASPTVVVDPPRTGLSKAVAAGLVGLEPRRIVYVSCDVATVARDARILTEAGYQLKELMGFDLFPNTAHVETVMVMDRA
ncbi:MAG: class I SAM-dependent RNA methyltransferase [Acidobacteria bacterium]|nr:class I SAM-dependent RNA methyltransferase [Acidobacteriota bacterium]